VMICDLREVNLLIIPVPGIGPIYLPDSPGIEVASINFICESRKSQINKLNNTIIITSKIHANGKNFFYNTLTLPFNQPP
jgi:hypothetical protein